MRFRLRTLLIVFLLLALSAPWWNQWRRDLSNWMWPATTFSQLPVVGPAKVKQYDFDVVSADPEIP
jgi:hypothetical protein